jgi:hypothetical protein
VNELRVNSAKSPIIRCIFARKTEALAARASSGHGEGNVA